MTNIPKRTPCFIILFMLAICAGCTKEQNQIYEKITNKSFQDVIQDSEFAITENNFRITNRLHIGEAIQKRGNDKFPENEVILFCNLRLAEKMLLIEPRYINYCPYKLMITESNEEYIISTRLLPTTSGRAEMDTFAKEMNQVLISMVEYAASDDPFILEKNDS